MRQVLKGNHFQIIIRQGKREALKPKGPLVEFLKGTLLWGINPFKTDRIQEIKFRRIRNFSLKDLSCTREILSSTFSIKVRSTIDIYFEFLHPNPNMAKIQNPHGICAENFLRYI